MAYNPAGTTSNLLDRHANFAFFIERKFRASSPGLRICLSYMSRKGFESFDASKRVMKTDERSAFDDDTDDMILQLYSSY